MQWSKLKKKVKNRFAKSVNGKVNAMQSNYRRLMVSYCIGLALLIVCANVTGAKEKTAQDTRLNSPRPVKTTKQAARGSQLTRQKNAKKMFQKNTPTTSLETETPNRRDLKDFLKGKSNSYKGFDSLSDELY